MSVPAFHPPRKERFLQRARALSHPATARNPEDTRSAGRSVEPEQGQATWWVPQLLPELSVCLAVQDPKFEGLDLSYVSASFSWGTMGFISINLTFFHL